MTNNSRVSNSMGNRVGNNSWVSNSMGNWVSNNSRVSNSMSNRVSNNSGVSNSVGISSSSFISNISNISIIIIGMIFDMLDTTIRKVDRVGTIYNTSTIIGLSLVEGSTRVVISNSISVSVGRGLSKVRLGISTNSVSNNWGMVDNRSMSNRNWVSNSYWVSNGMVKSMTKQLWGSGSCGEDSSKTSERLHVVV